MVLFLLWFQIIVLCHVVTTQIAGITAPTASEVIWSGTSYPILWISVIDIDKPSITVSIELVNFNYPDLYTRLGSNTPCRTDVQSGPTGCFTIASNISNSGNYTWQIPLYAPEDNQYYIWIYGDSGPPDAGSKTSQFFTIQRPVSSFPPSSMSGASSVSTMKSSATAPSISAFSTNSSAQGNVFYVVTTTKGLQGQTRALRRDG